MKRLIILFLALLPAVAFADSKQWVGQSQTSTTDWSDGYNWLQQGKPAGNDDVLIDKENASVIVGETFSIKSLAIGGKESEISLTKSDFVYGTIAPANSTDAALELRENGILVLNNVGDITLKGALKSSNQTAIQEPSFMFVAE